MLPINATGALPLDYLTPAETAQWFEGERERREDAWELSAWVVMQLVNGVARKLKSPVNMTTLIPGIHAKREAARERARKAEKKG